MQIQIGDEVRDMTADELAQHETDAKAEQDKAKAQTDKATARAALLTKLGITEAEAQLLLGGM